MLLRRTLFVALGATSLAQAQNAAPQNANWTRPFPPFRMIGGKAYLDQLPRERSGK